MSNRKVPKKIKVFAGVTVLLALLFAIQIVRSLPPSERLYSAVPLRTLIEKSDLVVYATIADIEHPSPPLSTVTNKWVTRAMDLFHARKRPSAIAHLKVIQTLKGRPVETALVDFPAEISFPAWAKTRNSSNAFVFLSSNAGQYHPVAVSYGAKTASPKQTDILLRIIPEFIAMDKLATSERESQRAEWVVRLIEDSFLRWDGAASWIKENGKPGDAVKKFPPNLTKRIEAVAFRDEPLAAGDELLLRELAVTQRRLVVRRLLRYLELASRPPDPDTVLEEPWRCHGAVELLIEVAGMPAAFKEEFRTAPYPDMTSSRTRREFVNRYLPRIEANLKEKSLQD